MSRKDHILSISTIYQCNISIPFRGYNVRDDVIYEDKAALDALKNVEDDLDTM